MKVLVVEDDPKLGELLSRVLVDDAHSVGMAASIAAATANLTNEHYDAIVLDWMLPDGDGLSFLKRIRNEGVHTPVMMLTARGGTSDRVEALRAGADDYLVKPFDIEELLARLVAITRRSHATANKWGDFEIDRLRGEVRIANTPITLTKREFSLLARLAEAPDQPLSRAELLSSVWHLTFDPGSAVVEVHVSRLREKMPGNAWRIETVRGVGYRFRTSR
jgi:DNA-binding response OmpR family regulator